ncbi:hypothetical protein PHYSODRAFT_445612, partial [Phytophthora sojae]
IPVPLYPGETLQQYTFKFKKWLTDKGEDLAVMRNDPNRERSFWHSFAHHRVGMLSTLTPPPGTHPKGQKRSVEDDYDDSYHRSASIERKRVRREKASIASGAKQLAGVDEEKRCVNVTGTEGDIERPKHGPTSALYPKSLPPWAQVLIDRVQELENKVTRLQEEVDRCHARNGDCSSQRGADQKHKNECCEEDALSPQYTAVDADEKIKDTGGLAKDVDTKDTTSNAAFAAPPQSAEDAEQRRLTEEYDRLNELIMMNETAIDDALAYVKAIKEVDEAGAQEHQSQIMELVVSINQEKERRSFALAAMITYSWSGREDELVSLLDVEISQAHSDEAKHEKCAAISSQIEEKDSELETLEMQMNDQLQ